MNIKTLLKQTAESIRNIFKKDIPSPAPQEEAVQTPPVPPKPFTTQARRRRETLLTKPNMLYVHDIKAELFHDRDCPRVADIPDEVFTMQEGFPKGKKFCNACYRKALIRKGINSQGQRINRYVNAFNHMRVRNEDLYLLFIVHKAQLISVSKNEYSVCIQVKDDRWRIQRNEDELQLHHNNYKVMADGERIFYDDFHRQKICGKSTFTEITRLICSHTAKKYKGQVS